MCDGSLEFHQSHVQGWVRMRPLLFPFCLYQRVFACGLSVFVCVCSAALEKASFLCGAEGSFWGWAADGPADMLSRFSSTEGPCHCSALSLPLSCRVCQPSTSPPPCPPTVTRPAGAADRVSVVESDKPGSMNQFLSVLLYWDKDRVTQQC